MANGVISLGVEGMDLAIRQLAEIKSPELQEKILKRAARALINSTKKGITKQVDLNGKPFGPYSSKTRHVRPRPKSRKMLYRLVKRLTIISVSPNTIAVGWRSPVESGIAGKQQYGFVQTFNKERLKAEDVIKNIGSRSGNVNYKANKRNVKKKKHTLSISPAYYKQGATYDQAAALIEAGYKVRIKGRGKSKTIKQGKGAAHTPSESWIEDNLTIGQAGLILKILKAEEGRDEWTTTLPARPFLGLTADNLELIAAAIRDELHRNTYRKK